MARAMALPSGTVTMLFTDIEGSTRLLEHLGARYADALTSIIGSSALRRVSWRCKSSALRATRSSSCSRAPGMRCARPSPPSGSLLRARGRAEWPCECGWGVHTGEPRVAGDDYVGMDVHRAARICSAAHGGQVVISEATERLLAGQPDEGLSLQGLGEHRLKDLSDPVRLYQVRADGLDRGLPTAAGDRTPAARASRVNGRPRRRCSDARGTSTELARLVRGPRGRLVTLVGPGGVGKTRLASRPPCAWPRDFADGARFVALASVFEPRELASAIARALAVPDP